ncbi:MAG: pilus assembly protein PilM [Lachnospiraceae bacterium]|nr:pilus assembly protein PilM [Lachnospiraceae bacterium]
MANKVISIEIGNDVTRIVQMDYQTKHPKVYRHATIPTPEGCISDGYINNENPALAEAIKNAITDEKMNGSKNVIFTIASSKILTREVMLPPIKANMIDATVQMNLGEYFPIDLSQHEVSNLVLEHIKEGDNAGRYRVLIIAAEKTLVQSYEALAKAIGLTLIQVDYVGNSIYQCFKNENANRCNMILKIEETQTSITIVDHQNLLLQRNVSYGIEEVIREVADRPAFGCKSYEDACQYIKNNICIFETLADTAASTANENTSTGTALLEARAAVTRSISGFINAISRVVDFYNSRYTVPIDRIFVCGMGGDFTGINTLLSNEMGIKTHILKKLEELQWVATTDLAGFHCYAAPIGASFAPVGLYSKAREDKEKHKTNYKGLGLLILAFAAVLSLALFIPRAFSLMSLKDENASLKAMEAQYIEAEEIYNRYTSTLDVYQQVYSSSLLLEHPNDNILAFFNELEQKLPHDIRVEAITSDDTNIVMTFICNSKEEAAGIINLFRDFDTLLSLQVGTIEEEHSEVTDEELTDIAIGTVTADTVDQAVDNFVDGVVSAIQNSGSRETSVKFTITGEYLPIETETQTESSVTAEPAIEETESVE